MKVGQLLVWFVFLVLLGAVIILALREFSSSQVMYQCGNQFQSTPCSFPNQGTGNQQTLNTTNQGTSTGNTSGTPVTGDCVGYESTGGGNTQSFPVTVNNGCVLVVSGYKGQNVGPYNWDNGAVVALGPGSYNFTLTDGAYQITSASNGQALFCRSVQSIQSNNQALSATYPLSGWSSC